MIWLYRVFYLPILLLLLPYFLKRMLKRGGYSRDFGHRFGFIPSMDRGPAGRRVWIQAVSVGEVNAIRPLIEQLIRNKVDVVLSTTTSTAYTLAKTIFSEQIPHIFIFPLDFILTSYLTWNKVRPDLCILMEGEVWPEHLQQAHNRKVPVLLINARMSDKSFKRHKKLRFLSKLFFKHISKILVSNRIDAQRFEELGILSQKLLVTGNLKCDAKTPKILIPEEKGALIAELGFNPSHPIVLGSSTWSPEEALLCQIQQGLGQKGIFFNLLLVPRHAERKLDLVATMPNHAHFRSNKRQAPGGTTIYVADTTGELPLFTQLADVAFIGRSLAPNNGGQSPIDAALLGVPLIYGPKMSNFKYICRSLEAEKGAVMCRDEAVVAEEIERILTNNEVRKRLSENALAWAQKNQGATDITCLEILQFLE